MVNPIRFTVLGTPSQKGSHIPMRYTRKNPRPGQQKHGIHQHDADPNLPAWTKDVGWAARQAYKGEMIETPVIVGIAIFVPYFTTGNPATEISLEETIKHCGYPVKHQDGDLDKQIRATLDAMNKIVYVDDKQVVGLYPIINKVMQYYACEGHPPGAIIEIEAI